LTTALALFLARGYENTPVQALIDEVGIAKGTFYHHFKGKEDLLVLLVEGMSLRVVEAIRPVVADPSLGAVDKMLAVSRAALAQKAEDLGPSMVVLVQQMRSKANRLLADAIETISRQWILPLYAQVIREGVDQGVFRVRDAGWAAELVLGAMVSMKDRIADLFLEAAGGDATALDRLVDLYRSVEEALERILGAAPGSLPIYTSVDVRALLSRILPGGEA